MDTFVLPMTEPHLQPYVLTSSRGMFNVPVPFAASLTWVFDGHDSLWIGRGERYVILKQQLTGDTLRVIEVDRSPEPVSDRERTAARSEIGSLLARIDVDAGQVDFSRIPDTKPVHGRIHLDEGGRLWVARVSAPAMTGALDTLTTVYDIFSERGRHVGVVSLGISSASALAFNRDHVAGVYHDELGVEQVVVYRLEIDSGVSEVGVRDRIAPDQVHGPGVSDRSRKD